MKKRIVLSIAFILFTVSMPCFAYVSHGCTSTEGYATYGGQPCSQVFVTQVVNSPILKSVPVAPQVKIVSVPAVVNNNQDQIVNLNAQIGMVDQITKVEESQMMILKEEADRTAKVVIGILVFLILEIIGCIALVIRIIKSKPVE